MIGALAGTVQAVTGSTVGASAGATAGTSILSTLGSTLGNVGSFLGNVLGSGGGEDSGRLFEQNLEYSDAMMRVNEIKRYTAQIIGDTNSKEFRDFYVKAVEAGSRLSDVITLSNKAIKAYENRIANEEKIKMETIQNLQSTQQTAVDSLDIPSITASITGAINEVKSLTNQIASTSLSTGTEETETVNYNNLALIGIAIVAILFIIKGVK